MTSEVAKLLGIGQPLHAGPDHEFKPQDRDVCAEYPHESLSEALDAEGRSAPVGPYNFQTMSYRRA